jgi:glycine dehydrogenase subunit 1
MFEYQTMICQLTGMEVANASHYDGATSLAEACLLALNLTKRSKIAMAPWINPRYREVIETYLTGHDATAILAEGYIEKLDELVDSEIAALVVQSPNYFGQLEDLEGLAEQVHSRNALLIVVSEPIALGLFKPPGDYGADIAVLDGQSLGLPVSFGGPHLGVFATRKDLVRRMARPTWLCADTGHARAAYPPRARHQ